MAVTVRFGVLGPLVVERGEVPVRITGRRQRLLLCLLLADASRTVPLARLVDGLWDGDEPADPVNTVQQYASHLRRAIGHDEPQEGSERVTRLVTSPPGYRLEVPVGVVDALDLTGLVGAARSALEGGEPDRAGELAQRALDLFRGRPFEEFADHPFLLGPVGRLEQQRLAAAEALADAALLLGDHRRVVHLLEPVPEWWEDREPLAAAYVASLAHGGRQGDALAAAERHRRSVDGRGLAPSAGFRRLVDEVARHGRPFVAAETAAVTRTATASALRSLLLAAPLTDDGTGALDYRLAVVAGLNDPAISAEATTWLAELQRHEPDVLATLDDARATSPGAGLELALGYARYWDWTGQHDRLQVQLASLLDAAAGAAPARRVSEAAGWLAYSYSRRASGPVERYLALARVAATDDPLALGRLLAVESVVRREGDLDASLRLADEATRLLDRHGAADESAWAHTVAAMAALDSDRRTVAEWHSARAHDRYVALGDRRGLAWIDVIWARLHDGRPTEAADFARRYGETTTAAMLDEGGV